MSSVVTVGETMAAFRGQQPVRLGGPFQLSIAGAESNVAIGLSRLGHDVSWVGRIGADELGELVLRTIRAEGVDVSQVSIDPVRPTGLLVFEPRVAGLARVLYYRRNSAGAYPALGEVMAAFGEDTSWLHVTGITSALGPAAHECVRAAVAHARSLGVRVSFDVNYRARLWSHVDAQAALLPLARSADIVFGDSDELALVTDTAATPAEELLGHGVGQVVVKLGADGARCHTADGVISAPARRVPVVDVIGAGDAFVAGYLSAELDGLAIADRLHRGVTTGAFAVGSHGDWEGLPTRDELTLLDHRPGTSIR